MKIAYIKPHSRFPERMPAADTLFGGLMWAFSHLYGKEFADGTAKLFSEKKPPFLISSMMPFLQSGGKKIRLYPTPAHPLEDGRKAVRKAKWCTEEALKSLAASGFSTKGIECVHGILFQEPEGLCFKNEAGEPKNPPFSSQTAERTAVNRITGGSMDRQLFFDKTTAFGKDTGLYFLIDFRDSTYEPRMASALRFLNDDGIGPNVSTGSGAFRFESIDEFKSPLLADGSYFMTLSPYCPDSVEIGKIKSSQCWYSLGRKKASIKSMHATNKEKPLWKKSAGFFREGSILPKPDGRVCGTFPLLAHKGENLSHDVYAYLYAFPLYLEVGK